MTIIKQLPRLFASGVLLMALCGVDMCGETQTPVVSPTAQEQASADEFVDVALDGDGDGVPDDTDHDNVPDKTAKKTWGDLAKCGIKRGATAAVGGWILVGAAAASCLFD